MRSKTTRTAFSMSYRASSISVRLRDGRVDSPGIGVPAHAPVGVNPPLPGSSGWRYGSGAMLFPIDDLLDERACYRLLLQAIHPEGLRCPRGHELPDDQAPHDRHREPVLDYRCRACG